MAKIIKRKLCWEASGSPQVVGYKLYWSEDGRVDYNSSCATLGNITEVILPDDLDGYEPAGGSVVFGLSAMDELGNESDMITLDVSNPLTAPRMPEHFWIESAEGYYIRGSEPQFRDKVKPIPLFEERKGARSDADSGPEKAKEPVVRASLKFIRGNDTH